MASSNNNAVVLTGASKYSIMTAMVEHNAPSVPWFKAPLNTSEFRGRPSGYNLEGFRR